MFSLYKKLCCRAFLTLRCHHELIVNLFAMVSDRRDLYQYFHSLGQRLYKLCVYTHAMDKTTL